MIAFLLSIVLSVMVIALHEGALQAMEKYYRALRLELLGVMLVLAALHIIEIAIFAGGMYVAIEWLSLGTVEGCTVKTVIDHWYVAATNFTSLGYGECIATGDLRIVFTLQGLVGLLLIGWSSAFAFWWMEHHGFEREK